MSKAFVLINSDLGNEETLLKELRNIDNVIEAHLTYGIYDIIIQVETKNMDLLKTLVAFKIRHLKNVRSTFTMTVADKI